MTKFKRFIVRTDEYLRWAIVLSPYAILIIAMFVGLPIFEILRRGDWLLAGAMWGVLATCLSAMLWSRLARWAA